MRGHACEAIGQKGRDARSNAKAARRVIAARGPSRQRGCDASPGSALLRARSNKADHERGTLKAGERRRAWAIELQPSIAALACGRAKERAQAEAAERGCGARLRSVEQMREDAARLGPSARARHIAFEPATKRKLAQPTMFAFTRTRNATSGNL